jgi:hypothetical protein
VASPSVWTSVLFIVLVLVVWFLVNRAFQRAFPKSLLPTALVLLYLVLPAILARSGALDRYDPLPAPALLMVGALTLVTVFFTISPLGAKLATQTGLVALVGLQAFRIPVELLLHRLHAENVIPVQMTYVGRNFDIVTGVSAMLLAIWLARRPDPPRGVVFAWNLLGLLLLANIVTIAILATPVPFRRSLEEPPNRLPSMFPFVWLPTFLVQVALGCHVLIFRLLLLRRGSTP